jgi:signal transduction histidine kinase/DNA-binding response OmpR family regulator/HAMP domain-containing protein
MPTTRERQGRLFRKYVVAFVLLVFVALFTSGVIETYFSYGESKSALSSIEREKARNAATTIQQFIAGIEKQIGWANPALQLGGSVSREQRRDDYLRLLRQALEVTEVAYLDANGVEQLRISRLAMNQDATQQDFSADERFRVPRTGTTYYGPVYFRNESEPYMTIAIAENRDQGGVTVADVNLKFIWDVISRIKIGQAGYAYVVDGNGQLIAHPDISLVLQKTSLASLPQIQTALATPAILGQEREQATIATDLRGRQVLTAYETVSPPGWSVFVDQPLEEAFAPIFESFKRTIFVLILGIGLSVLASMVLARKMVRPIQALQAGAARIGGGALDQRIEVRTGDELEALAEEFNSMTGQLRESYATLEQKVEDRTRDLAESLEQQTATAEVLQVISRSAFDLDPVLETLIENATRLCGAPHGVIMRFDGEIYRMAAHSGAPQAVIDALAANPPRPGRGTLAGRVAMERRAVHIIDVLDDAEYKLRPIQELGFRTMLGVPMLREGTLIGVIVIWKTRVEPFTEKQIELVSTFADQAVIAIENVRLFQEVEARNRDLAESLEQQTATAEVLQIISRSAFDLQPVLDTLVENAARLCSAEDGYIFQPDSELYRVAAAYCTDPDYRHYLEQHPIPTGPGSVIGRVAAGRQTVHVPDVMADPDYRLREQQTQGGYRTVLGVPLLRDGDLMGVFMLTRNRIEPFAERQIELVKTFADQAVIAIENVRLFQEVQERTRELARSVEELQALGAVSQAVNSTLDLQEVLTTIVAHAAQLSGTEGGAIYEYDETSRQFELRATHGMSEELIEAVHGAQIRLGETVIGEAAARREAVQVADLHDAPDYPVRAELERAGFRALLAVPLLREEQIVGALVVRRRTPGEFPKATVDLLQTFAAQSVLAIQNARLFQEIEDKSRQLEIASQHKSEFLANMSHELRTPLNAIIGFSEVLIEQMFGELNEKQEEYLQDILTSGRHLLSLINDILDLSKVEAGRMELELGTFALPEALENGLTMIKERAGRHGIQLTLDVDPRLGMIQADERKVKQVVFNLLSNAIKFTPDGGQVAVTAREVDDEIEIAVRDTGIGIAPEDQARIFEEFQQARHQVTKSREGTGLGLALTRKFVELHGGRIWVESEVGTGSTFTFTIPMHVELMVAVPGDGQAPGTNGTNGLPHAPALPTVDGTGATVLLVEDDPNAVALLSLYLQGAGFQVVVAGDGEEALQMARILHPDGITLDIFLPRVDGWDFLARAKADPELADIPVVIVSMLDERGKGFALGAAEYLVKPVDRDLLLATLQRLVARGPAKVLAIDDDPMAINLVQAVLGPQGFTVLKATGGEEGIALARQEHPALVILDLMMPGVDGFTVVERLRADPATAAIPIVILTAKTMTDEDKARLNGQISYLAEKGQFSPAAFVELVRRFCPAPV